MQSSLPWRASANCSICRQSSAVNMSVFDGALVRPRAAPYLQFPHRRYPGGRRPCACVKVKLGDDAEQEHRASHRGFSIQVPAIPKLGDIESARRLLESAFQNLSFDMPKIQIDSALQGLPFAIPKLAMPMRVLVLDITGFVATKLKKRQKRELQENVCIIDQWPRSPWPRKSIPARTIKALLMENEDMVSSIIDGGPGCPWPRKSIPARQSSYGLGSTGNGEKQESSEVSSEPSDDDVAPPAHVEEVAELPRRLLATSVGLTVMNHLAKGSMVTSVFDLCSSLPASSMGPSEDEDADIDIGRRTLLVFIKGPTGLA